uniref:Uncharacterized protein n=1 Tax=Aegilops tauschii subsp. strangulata TaxID=200361 RepID=A0A453HCS3_AEGTS
ADWDGLAVGADEDDLGLLEDDPPHSERRVDCWAITEDTLSAAQQEDLSTMMNLLNIKQHQARSLFIHHRWKIDCIYDCLDRKGRDRMLREAGIVLQEKSSMLIGASRTPSRSVQCNVCFDDDLSPAAVSTMDCGHCFCNDSGYVVDPQVARTHGQTLRATAATATRRARTRWTRAGGS